MSEFISLLAQEQLPDEEKAKRCQAWLNENPQHEMANFVRMVIQQYENSAKQSETIAKLSETNAKLSETSAKQSETIAKLSETNAKLSETIASRSLVRVKDIFPFLRDHTTSLPHYPKNHEHANVTEVSIGKEIKEIADRFLKDPTLWDAPFVEEGGSCDSESRVLTFIFNLLTAVLKGMNLGDTIDVVLNRTLAGAECDALLVYKRNRLPFAVIEVKKNGNSSEGRTIIFEGLPKNGEEGGNRVAGEVFAEMKALELFGFPTNSVTGMISTGNQWRMVGLMGDDWQPQKPINATHVNDGFERFLSLDCSDVEEVGDTPCVSPGEKPLSFVENDGAAKAAEPSIWAAEIVPSHEGVDTQQLYTDVEKSGECIVAQVVSFVARGCSSLSDLLFKQKATPPTSITFGQRLPCRILKKPQKENEKKIDEVFSFGTVILYNLCLDNFNRNLENFYVIQHLGMGEYGNVCLSTSITGGSCCAIKFYHDKSKRQRYAWEEKNNWQLVYGSDSDVPDPFVMTVAGGDCLVMPYLHPIQETERHRFLENGVIKKSLQKFANSGYVHLDIKWRHLRRWKQRYDRFFLLDLGEGSLKHVDGNQAAIDRWINESTDKLRASAGENKMAKTGCETPEKLSPDSKKCKLDDSDVHK